MQSLCVNAIISIYYCLVCNLPDWYLLPHIWLLSQNLHDFVLQFLNIICLPFLL